MLPWNAAIPQRAGVCSDLVRPAAGRTGCSFPAPPQDLVGLEMNDEARDETDDQAGGEAHEGNEDHHLQGHLSLRWMMRSTTIASVAPAKDAAMRDRVSQKVSLLTCGPGRSG